MPDTLTVQSEMAADFIEKEWKPIQEQAREIISDRASEIDEMILCGCGDSHHAAINLELAMAVWTGRRVRSARAMEASRYLVPTIRSRAGRTLVIGISASGEVARTLEAIELAAAMGALTLAITGAAESRLARTAHLTLSLPTPTMPVGPGLLNYLASLLMGFSLTAALTPAPRRGEIERGLEQIPDVLRTWDRKQIELGKEAARGYREGAVVFLGTGPAYGSALFSAAKLIETAGVQAWGQDVEEWTHLEFFCEPADMPTWLLSSRGRSLGRESEVEAAARTIGRQFYLSTWEGGKDWPAHTREALAPLGLWVGPIALASRLAFLIGEVPFRGFGGGRSQVEGGGANLIRKSERISPDEISRFGSNE